MLSLAQLCWTKARSRAHVHQLLSPRPEYSSIFSSSTMTKYMFDTSSSSQPRPAYRLLFRVWCSPLFLGTSPLLTIPSKYGRSHKRPVSFHASLGTGMISFTASFFFSKLPQLPPAVARDSQAYLSKIRLNFFLSLSRCAFTVDWQWPRTGALARGQVDLWRICVTN